MANIYVSSASYAAVATWAASTAYTSTANGGRGSYVRQLATPATGSERVFRCTTSGTSLASEPTWTLTKNGTTTESGGPVWTECTGQEADQVSGTWKAPHARLLNALAATWGAAGDNFYIGGNHAETQASAMVLAIPGTAASINNLYCVSATGSVPPVSADLRTTATVTTTSFNPLSFSTGYAYIYGITFNCGSGAVSTQFNIITGNAWLIFENCNLYKLGTTAGNGMVIGSPGMGVAARLDLINTKLQLGNPSDSIILWNCDVYWSKTANAISGAATPTKLISSLSIGSTIFNCDGVDLSAIGSGSTLIGIMTATKRIYFKNCKLDSSVIISANQTNATGPDTYVMRSDSSGTNYRNEKYSYAGIQTTETTFVRTDGASDGITPISWKISRINSAFVTPIELFPIAIWNPVTSANVTAAVEAFCVSGLPTNKDIWMDVSYLGSASSALSSFVTSGISDPLASASNCTASSAGWDSLATARANSTAYVIGDIRKVSSNPGRIFYCVTSGTTASSVPAGYATAIDGDTISDGTASFIAVFRFKISVTMSSPQPAQQGLVYANIKIASTGTRTYVDPLITLS